MNNFISGLLVLVAIGICSRITACAALWGSTVGFLMGMWTGVDPDVLIVGLRGYNASLTVQAVFGMFYPASWSSFCLATLAGIFTSST